MSNLFENRAFFLLSKNLDLSSVGTGLFSRSPILLTDMRKMYVYRTAIGSFYIVEHEGKFHPMFNSQLFGSYDTPQQAAEHLADGHTFISYGTDISALGIPADLTDWS